MNVQPRLASLHSDSAILSAELPKGYQDEVCLDFFMLPEPRVDFESLGNMCRSFTKLPIKCVLFYLLCLFFWAPTWWPKRRMYSCAACPDRIVKFNMLIGGTTWGGRGCANSHMYRCAVHCSRYINYDKFLCGHFACPETLVKQTVLFQEKFPQPHKICQASLSWYGLRVCESVPGLKCSKRKVKKSANHWTCDVGKKGGKKETKGQNASNRGWASRWWENNSKKGGAKKTGETQQEKRMEKNQDYRLYYSEYIIGWYMIWLTDCDGKKMRLPGLTRTNGWVSDSVYHLDSMDTLWKPSLSNASGFAWIKQ